MKVIFLDVDGELTYSLYENTDTYDIDIEKVKLLKQIVDKTGAKIVLSSSWRGFWMKCELKDNMECKYHRTKCYYKLVEILSKCGLSIYDDIPYIPAKIINTNESTEVSLDDIENIKCEFGTGRGAEVRKWIDDNDLESYVILDDENYNWETYGLDENWIQPSWFGKNGGLQDEHVLKAIKILNGNED